ncbi:ABC transporter ATP-binding protein/permease [Anaeromicropila herbilytica]|uniref:Sulfate ABC transporter ATP-binding protein n=1 Tax=Anaeromicropila herbilytica TaxID=2785025 RepID=A0A7R7IAX2_9FIRM|nr:ABC transporter ATP-binding protein/permease [Anaeromicropila herbilytica]BCN28923.1 sulfate ABC transporter ATP-binding protein [Anaeromicropila herbilytica]
MIQLKNICKTYVTGDFKQVALDGVSLNFRESEFVAILGKSGSGKTTLLNVLGGLDQYDNGDLIINGRSTKEFKESDWDSYRNNSVGFIFQSYNLISHLSIIDNVEMGMTLSGVSSAEKHKKALDVLEKVGLGKHLHKKPNQLSGGQMQRVAIARALANDPDIILADEPTGALDTQTSVQIMELIKEIAKEKLVVMVTHNPELATEYADRIVQFADGKVVDDSYPFLESSINNKYNPKKTSMNYLTALKLSAKNITTKKWRTAITAVASSIGIIGVAIVLSLSNGFDKQINQFEKDSLSNYPITIGKTAISMQTAPRMQGDKDKKLKEFPDTNVIYPYDTSEESNAHVNKITKEYVNYVEKLDTSLLDGISYTRNVNMNLLKMEDGKATSLSMSAAGFMTYPSKDNSFKDNYIKEYYDMLSGEYPQSKTDLILVTDQYNQIDKNILKALGFADDKDSIDYDTIVGTEFKLIYNDDYYKKAGKYFVIDGTPTDLSNLYNSKQAVTLRISGIARIKKDVNISALSAGVAYSDELAKDFITNAKNSEIVKAQQKVDYNVMNGSILAEESESGVAMSSPGSASSNGAPNMMSGNSGQVTLSKEDVLEALGAANIPSSISIYPVDFEAKEQITDYLDKWNTKLEEKNQIQYTDMAAMITNLSGNIMDAITIVLVAFAGISLVVSMIMIGIIIYISVLERTREIGVLRALGARKKDITRVFNAEIFIIGASSGIFAIAISYLLTIPVNAVLYNVTDLKNVAQLNPIHAVILILISVVLTLIGGFIPAKMAAKKDPVVALRSE